MSSEKNPPPTLPNARLLLAGARSRCIGAALLATALWAAAAWALR